MIPAQKKTSSHGLKFDVQKSSEYQNVSVQRVDQGICQHSKFHTQTRNEVAKQQQKNSWWVSHPFQKNIGKSNCIISTKDQGEHI